LDATAFATVFKISIAITKKRGYQIFEFWEIVSKLNVQAKLIRKNNIPMVCDKPT